MIQDEVSETACGDWKPRTADGVDFVIGMPLYRHHQGSVSLVETEGGTLHQNENGYYYVIRWLTDKVWYLGNCYADPKRALTVAVEYWKARRQHATEKLREVLQELKSAI